MRWTAFALAGSLAFASIPALADDPGEQEHLFVVHNGKASFLRLWNDINCRKLATDFKKKHRFNNRRSLALCTSHYASADGNVSFYLSGQNLDLLDVRLSNTSLPACKRLGRFLKLSLLAKSSYKDIRFTCYD